MNTTERPGMVALVTDALGRSADLIQTEIRLARVELGEKADALKTSVVSGLVMMLVGTAFMVYYKALIWWELALLNVALFGVMLAVQPLLPKTGKNRRVPLAGSRFSPLKEAAPDPTGALATSATVPTLTA